DEGGCEDPHGRRPAQFAARVRMITHSRSRAPTTVAMNRSFAGPRSAVCRPIKNLYTRAPRGGTPPDSNESVKTHKSVTRLRSVAGPGDAWPLEWPGC